MTQVTTRRTVLRGALGAPFIGLSLLSTESCGSATEVLRDLQILNAAVAAALAALAVIPGIAQEIPIIDKYLAEVSTFAAQVSAVLASTTDTTAQKIAEILKDAAAMAVPNITNPAARALIEAVVAAVGVVLAAIGIPVNSAGNAVVPRGAVKVPKLHFGRLHSADRQSASVLFEQFDLWSRTLPASSRKTF